MGSQLAIQEVDLKQRPHIITRGEVNEERIGWFAKNFPHFFTTKVVEHRKKPLVTPAVQPKAAPVFMKRNMGNGQIGFIGLKQYLGNRFKFFCKQTSREWLIEPIVLVGLITSINRRTSRNTVWVGIRIGNEVLTVDRTQLLHALRYFKLLTTP